MTREKFLAYCRFYNTYRTKRYIVAQRIGWVTDDINGNYTLGIDYRFRRTTELDAIYDECFAVRQNPEGVRLRMDESIVKQMN